MYGDPLPSHRLMKPHSIVKSVANEGADAAKERILETCLRWFHVREPD
jgi:hypothetical protein